MSSIKKSKANEHKYIERINVPFSSLKEFCDYIRKKNIGSLISMDDAYEKSQSKPFLILGRIVRLTPKLSTYRKSLCKQTAPATTILLRELIDSQEALKFGKVFKVKFAGSIATEVESAELHIGDRVALINPVISENTDFVYSHKVNHLSCLLLDSTSSSLILSAKVCSPMRNKLLERVRCATPVSDGKSEGDISESESIENKRSPISLHTEAINKIIGMKRNILKDRTLLQNSPKKIKHLSPDKEKPKQIVNNINMTTPEKRNMGTHIDLEQSVNVSDCNHEPDQKIEKVNRKESNSKHDYIKIRDISDKHLNKKIDMFVIVLDVRQSEARGKKKNCLIAKVIDETSCCRLKPPFTIYVYYEDVKPKVERKWILRIRHVKIESANGIFDGRVFSAGSIVSFPPTVLDLEHEQPITLRKAPYEVNDFDMGYVENLRKFMIGKNWNLLVMMYGFYPKLPTEVKQNNFEGITNESWFSLNCQIKSVRWFFDPNVAVLTVVDGTTLQHFSYRVPKECRLWSEVISSREKYTVGVNEIDIIVKKIPVTIDDDILKENKKISIQNVQVIRNETKNGDALIFVVDASRPETKIELLPSNFEFKQPDQSNESNQKADGGNICDKANEADECININTESEVDSEFVRMYKSKAREIIEGLEDASQDTENVVGSEIVVDIKNYPLTKQAVHRKKLFFNDSLNSHFFNSSESSCDLFDHKKRQLKECAVVLNKISITANSSKTETNAKSVDKNVEIADECSNEKIDDSIDHVDNQSKVDTMSEPKEKGPVICADEVIIPELSNINNDLKQILEKEKIKLPSNLMSFNLFPTIQIEKIDDTCNNSLNNSNVFLNDIFSDANLSSVSKDETHESESVNVSFSKAEATCSNSNNYNMRLRNRNYKKKSCRACDHSFKLKKRKCFSRYTLSYSSSEDEDSDNESSVSFYIYRKKYVTRNRKRKRKICKHNDTVNKKRKNLIDDVDIHENSNLVSNQDSHYSNDDSSLLRNIVKSYYNSDKNSVSASNDKISSNINSCSNDNDDEFVNNDSNKEVMNDSEIVHEKEGIFNNECTTENFSNEKGSELQSDMISSQVDDDDDVDINLTVFENYDEVINKELSDNYNDSNDNEANHNVIEIDFDDVFPKDSFKDNIINPVISDDKPKYQLKHNSEQFVRNQNLIKKISDLSQDSLGYNLNKNRVVRRLKKRKRKDIRPITGRYQLVGPFTPQCNSPVHIIDNKSFNSSDMDLTLDEESDSIRSDFSHKINYNPTYLCEPVLKDLNCKRKELENNRNYEMYKMEECKVLTNINLENDMPQIMSVFTATKKRLNSDTIKSSLKHKILSRKAEILNNNYLAKNNNIRIVAPPSPTDSIKTVKCSFRNERKFGRKKCLDLNLGDTVTSSTERSISNVEHWLQRLEEGTSEDPEQPLEQIKHIDLRDIQPSEREENLEVNLDMEIDEPQQQHHKDEQHPENLQQQQKQQLQLEQQPEPIHNSDQNATKCAKEIPQSQFESQSQSVSEFIKATAKDTPIPRAQMSAVIVKSQMSFVAVIWDLRPTITDNSLDVISGFCKESCENFFLYSTLKFTADSKPICPACFAKGKEAEVKLQFLFELLLMLQTGHSITALVYGEHANKFVGCSTQDYLHDEEKRAEVVKKLQYFLGTGHNNSIRYTPPFPVCLIPISLTAPDQAPLIRFCVINTELPDINYQSAHSMFINIK